MAPDLYDLSSVQEMSGLYRSYMGYPHTVDARHLGKLATCTVYLFFAPSHLLPLRHFQDPGDIAGPGSHAIIIIGTAAPINSPVQPSERVFRTLAITITNNRLLLLIVLLIGYYYSRSLGYYYYITIYRLLLLAISWLLLLLLLGGFHRVCLVQLLQAHHQLIRLFG